MLVTIKRIKFQPFQYLKETLKFLKTSDMIQNVLGCKGGVITLFKYYFGIGIMCTIFSVMALFFSEHAGTLATIYLGMAGAFLAIAFVTSGSESRW